MADEKNQEAELPEEDEINALLNELEASSRPEETSMPDGGAEGQESVDDILGALADADDSRDGGGGQESIDDILGALADAGDSGGDGGSGENAVDASADDDDHEGSPQDSIDDLLAQLGASAGPEPAASAEAGASIPPVQKQQVDAAHIQNAAFENFGSDEGTREASVDMLMDIELEVKLELGRTSMYVQDILKLGRGQVVELDRLAGDPLDIYVNERLIAKGEVLILNDNFCVRITEILQSPGEVA